MIHETVATRCHQSTDNNGRFENKAMFFSSFLTYFVVLFCGRYLVAASIICKTLFLGAESP